MQPVYLFSLASSRAQWLSMRQSVVAENVTNANTPNYRAREIQPFEATLDRTALTMRSTGAGHISLADYRVESEPLRASLPGSQQGSGVSLDKELLAAGEVARDYQLNTAIVKAFHRMWMASVKG